MPVLIRKAKIAEHDAIRKIAHQTSYTKAFSNMIFSGDDCYADGRIRVAVSKGKIVGFTCFRHRKRNPATVLYFIGVDEQYRGKGIGQQLIRDLGAGTELELELNVMKDNPAFHAFCKAGFVKVGEAYEGKAWVMRRPTKNPASNLR
jgi:ribosomal protein S18 acetylase RimI-like enzyme